MAFVFFRRTDIVDSKLDGAFIIEGPAQETNLAASRRGGSYQEAANAVTPLTHE